MFSSIIVVSDKSNNRNKIKINAFVSDEQTALKISCDSTFLSK